MVEGKWRALCVFTIGAHRQGNILYPAGKPGKTGRKTLRKTAGTERKEMAGLGLDGEMGGERQEECRS